MKTINMDLPYKILEGDKAQGMTPKGCTEHVIRSCIIALYPQAMTRDASQMWGSIMEKMMESNGKLELDDSEFRWLSEKIDKAELKAMMSGYLWTLRRHFEIVRNS